MARAIDGRNIARAMNASYVIWISTQSNTREGVDSQMWAGRTRLRRAQVL